MRDDATFIGIEVDDSIVGDAEIAQKLQDACPVDIFANAGGKLETLRVDVVVAGIDWTRFAPAFTLSRPRPLLRGLPEVTERLSHGSPTFFVRDKKTFVMFLDDHHGDGHLALWCAAPAVSHAAAEVAKSGLGVLAARTDAERRLFAALAQLLYGHGANILDSDQHTDPIDAQFFRLLFQCAAILSLAREQQRDAGQGHRLGAGVGDRRRRGRLRRHEPHPAGAAATLDDDRVAGLRRADHQPRCAG